MENVNPFEVTQLAEPIAAPPRLRNDFISLLKAGCTLYVSNFLAVAGLTLLVWTPLELFQSYMAYFVLDADDLRGSMRLQQFLDGVFGIIGVGGFVAIGAGSLRGERISVWEALGEGLVNWPRLFWSRLVYGFLLVLALIAFVIPALYVGPRLLLIDQVAVIERRSGMECLKQSFVATLGAYWRMFALWVVPAFALMAATIVLEMPAVLYPVIDHWLMSTTTSMLARLLMPVQTLIFTAAYFAATQPADGSSELAAETLGADHA